jgi:mannose-1-phosphate guanylyltransferase/mannose-6-phosphate isomerase
MAAFRQLGIGDVGSFRRGKKGYHHDVAGGHACRPLPAHDRPPSPSWYSQRSDGSRQQAVRARKQGKTHACRRLRGCNSSHFRKWYSSRGDGYASGAIGLSASWSITALPPGSHADRSAKGLAGSDWTQVMLSLSRSRSIKPLIMCGGAGTRLWPVSRSSLPKQFAPLLGKQSSFQDTVLRVRGPGFDDRPLVLTNADFRFIVDRQLQEIGVAADIVIEPCRRDSGPAILAGCMLAAEDPLDTPLLVVASDHIVRDDEAFRAAAIAGLPASLAGRLVVFGIAPTYAASEYGYIEAGAKVEGEAFHVARFAEKPDPISAALYLRQGLLWNSGNFLFTARALIEEYSRLDGRTAQAAREAVAGARNERGARLLDGAAFATTRQQSIDYAVFEQTARAAVVGLSCGWSDIGNWNALYAIGDRDKDNNVCNGNAELVDATGCFVSTDGALTSLLGVTDLVVVANRDAILVADRHRSVEVKQLVEALRAKGRTEADTHWRVHRPWGWYQVIDVGQGFQVKHIHVAPGGRLSLQKHAHRAEHWVVVAGTALVTVGTQVQRAETNDHVFIPRGSVHRLENPEGEPVELVEVQSGAYLGEDDIERLEDAYERA